MPPVSDRLGIRSLHPTRTNRFCGDAQRDPNHDIEASDRKEKETRREGKFADVVREN